MGDYKIVKLIGQGGMARVYLAYRPGAAGFSKPVAIKQMIKISEKYHELYVHYFLWEAFIVICMPHPNILQIEDFFEDEEGCFSIAMEYIDGPDLAHLLTVVGSLPLHVATYIIIEVYKALDHAHNAEFKGEPLDLLHRDVSPSNILLSRHGIVKLCDFGVAKVMSRVLQEMYKVNTEGNRFRGKPPYSTAEALMEVEDLDQTSDNAGAGLCFYEMLAGKPAYAPGNSAFYNVLHGIMTPIEKINPKLPRKLTKIMASIYAHDRKDRPQTAAEIIDLLQPFCPNFMQAQKDLKAIIRQAVPKRRTTQPFKVDPKYQRLMMGLVKGRVNSELLNSLPEPAPTAPQENVPEQKNLELTRKMKPDGVPEPIDNAPTEKNDVEQLAKVHEWLKQQNVPNSLQDGISTAVEVPQGNAEVPEDTPRILRRRRTIPIDIHFQEGLKRTRQKAKPPVKSVSALRSIRAKAGGRGALIALAILGAGLGLTLTLFSSQPKAKVAAAEVAAAQLAPAAIPPSTATTKMAETNSPKAQPKPAPKLRTKRVAKNPNAQMGSLHILPMHNTDEVDVAIDGIQLGRAPVHYEVEPGTHRVYVRNRTQNREADLQVHLDSGQRKEYKY